MNEIAQWRLYPGRGRLPDAAAPDVRGRSHRISAEVLLNGPEHGGVLLAHGDSTGGYAVRVEDRRLVHDYVHARIHTVTRSRIELPVSRRVRLEVRVTRIGLGASVRMLIDGGDAGTGVLPAMARSRTGYTGVDVGCDRGLTVGGYLGPARFTGRFSCVQIEAAGDQWLDDVAVLEIEAAAG